MYPLVKWDWAGLVFNLGPGSGLENVEQGHGKRFLCCCLPCTRPER